MNTVGNQSFKNPNDNNPRIQALARVRGGGARVPPKVQNRPVNISYPPIYYRIISAGLNAMYNDDNNPDSFNGNVITANLSATGISPGIYSYTDLDPTENALVNVLPLNKFLRSYNVLTIDRKTRSTTFKNYDVYNTDTSNNNIRPTNAGRNMINYLNSLSPSVIVIIATFDEPETYGNDNIPLSQEFVDAIKRCGGSSSFGSFIGSYDPNDDSGNLKYRSAYILVGVPGIGVGNGLEYYKGDNDGYVDSVIDLRIAVDYTGNYHEISRDRSN
jgi:hypothetical protein